VITGVHALPYAENGSVASIALPGGGTLGMYQPKHPVAI
jgi:hypothetical protein